MNCPRCSAALRTEFYEGVEVDRCAGCQGIWLDNQELKPILDRREVIFSEAEIAAVQGVNEQVSREDRSNTDGPPCPVCGALMNEYTYMYDSGIVLDQCTEHGVWFDAGELEKVQIVYEEGRRRLEQDIKRYKPILEKTEEEFRLRVDEQGLEEDNVAGRSGVFGAGLFHAICAGILRLS